MQHSAPLLRLENPAGFVSIDESLLTGKAGVCDLFVVFSGQSASFALQERSSKRFLAAETLLAGEEGGANGPSFLRKCLKESKVFRLNAHRKSTVAVDNPHYTLLPSGMFRDGDEQSLLRFSVNRDDLIASSVSVEGFDLRVVFGMPPEEESLLHQLLPGCSLVPAVAAALAHIRLSHANSKAPVMHLVAHPGLTSVLVVAGKKLQLANSFRVSGTEETVYHLLNVCEQLELDRHALGLVLSGTGHVIDSLMERLPVYFRGIRMAETNAFRQLTTGLGSIPSGTLLPVLTVSLCES
ncbi:MAG: hypothetical protein RL213_1342 [Bacteroidota bacterium]|jgi:hypothetical protein